MKKEMICCDKCGTALKEENGIRITGNVHVSSIDQLLGLIGSAFKDVMLDGKNFVTKASIPVNDFCAKCFIECMADDFKLDLFKELKEASKNWA